MAHVRVVGPGPWKSAARRVLSVLALGLTLGWSPPVFAVATLHIGPGSGTPCQTGGCPVFGDEVNAIAPRELDIFQQSGGAPSLTNLLLILGIPNFTGAAPAIFSTSLGTGQLGGIDLYGGTGWNPTTGFAGSMTPGQEVYGFLGLGAQQNNSNSFTNWAAADSFVDQIIAATFGIYVYTLSGPLGAHQALDVIFASDVPAGTFAVAFGKGGGKVFGTPFTEAGLETVATPEPHSALLFASALVGLVARRRRLTNPA